MYHVPRTMYHIVPEWVRLLWAIASNLVLSFTTLCLMALPIHNANLVPFFLSFLACSTDSVVLIYALQISVVLAVVVVNMP